MRARLTPVVAPGKDMMSVAAQDAADAGESHTTPSTSDLIDTPNEAWRPEPLSLDRLADLAGMTPRNVRAYQQRGLLPPPLRRGRNAWYSWDHLSRLRLVSALHEHGLTLKVIADLVDRGAADSELARLDRDELSATWAKTTRVPMAPGVAQWLRADAPDLLAKLTAYSVVEDRCGVIHANAAALGVAAALGARDIHPARTGRVALAAAHAAQHVVSDLVDELGSAAEQGSARQREVGLLFMQFAATCFADVLHSNLLEAIPPGQSDADAAGPADA